MKVYIGDCRTILESDSLFDDATELAQVVESAEPLTIAEASKMTYNPRGDTFSYHDGSGLLIGYDTQTDVHYFYL